MHSVPMACPHPVLSSAQNSSAPWRPLLRPHLPHVHPSHGSQHLLLLFLTSLAPAVSTAAVNQYVLNTSAPLPHSPPACLPGEPSSVAALEWLRAAGENRISKAALHTQPGILPHCSGYPTFPLSARVRSYPSSASNARTSAWSSLDSSQ